jgi:hypothetical protein
MTPTVPTFSLPDLTQRASSTPPSHLCASQLQTTPRHRDVSRRAAKQPRACICTGTHIIYNNVGTSWSVGPGFRKPLPSHATSTTLLPLLQEPLFLSCSVHNSVSAAAGATGRSCDAPGRRFCCCKSHRTLLQRYCNAPGRSCNAPG